MFLRRTRGVSVPLRGFEGLGLVLQRAETYLSVHPHVSVPLRGFEGLGPTVLETLKYSIFKVLKMQGYGEVALQNATEIDALKTFFNYICFSWPNLSYPGEIKHLVHPKQSHSTGLVFSFISSMRQIGKGETYFAKDPECLPDKLSQVFEE